MLVEIWSDVVCPWCYVGKVRFERALAQLSWRDDVQVRYRPFELDPSVPSDGVDLKRYVDRKYDDRARLRAARAQVVSAAAELGINFRWADQRRVNTFDAHRLLEWALRSFGPAHQAALMERLLVAHFTDNVDVSDHGVLARLAEQAGLDPMAAAEQLATGGYAAAVRAAERQAAELEIHAVPTFVVAGGLTIPGVQEADTFDQLLTRARERLALQE